MDRWSLRGGNSPAVQRDTEWERKLASVLAGRVDGTRLLCTDALRKPRAKPGFSPLPSLVRSRLRITKQSRAAVWLQSHHHCMFPKLAPRLGSRGPGVQGSSPGQGPQARAPSRIFQAPWGISSNGSPSVWPRSCQELPARVAASAHVRVKSADLLNLALRLATTSSTLKRHVSPDGFSLVLCVLRIQKLHISTHTTQGDGRRMKEH